MKVTSAIKTEPKDYHSKPSKSLMIKPSMNSHSTQQYLNTGDQFTGFSKSLSKKSEYFFSELEV